MRKAAGQRAAPGPHVSGCTFDLVPPAGFEPARAAPEAVSLYSSDLPKRARRDLARAHIGRSPPTLRSAGVRPPFRLTLHDRHPSFAEARSPAVEARRPCRGGGCPAPCRTGLTTRRPVGWPTPGSAESSAFVRRMLMLICAYSCSSSWLEQSLISFDIFLSARAERRLGAPGGRVRCTGSAHADSPDLRRFPRT